MPYFVMLNHPAGYPTPIINSEDQVPGADVRVYLYESEAAADKAMSNHAAAKAWGYETYEWSGR
jgi:hypothetical protein